MDVPIPPPPPAAALPPVAVPLPQVRQQPVPPNYTLYLNNLNERVRVELLRKLLYEMFGQYGRILDIICSKRGQRRGQAFIVFESIEVASTALAKRQGAILIDKPMRIAFARTKSDAVARLDGTYEEHVRKRKLNAQYKSSLREKDSKRRKLLEGEGPPAEDQPSMILLVENLPDEIRQQPHLVSIFKNREGCSNVRYLDDMNVAYLRFQNVLLAERAKQVLDGHKLYKKALSLSYVHEEIDGL